MLIKHYQHQITTFMNKLLERNNFVFSMLFFLASTSFSFCADASRTTIFYDEPDKKSSNNNELPLIDVTFYHINLELHDLKGNFYEGNVICDFKALSNVNMITLDLVDALKVTIVKSQNENLKFIQNNNQLKITFPKKMIIGQSYRIEINYGGKPQTIIDSGIKKGMVYATHGNNEPVIATLSTPFLSHYWFPCNDKIADKADSVQIDIILPDTTINNLPLIVVSNGKLQGQFRIKNNRKMFKWRHSYPIAPCYVFFAVSNYRKNTETILNDFGHIQPIDFYVFEEDYEASLPQMEMTKNVVAFFTKKFGPYPFEEEQLAFAQIGFYSGIETQTCPIIENFTNRRFYTIVHELAHAWFANNVTAKNWQNAWLHEGFATYAEVLWDEHKYGKSAYRNSIMKRAYYQGGTIYGEATTNPFQVFSGIVYNKGAYVLHLLRGLVGDEVFFSILQTYLQTYQYGNADTYDFIKICEAESGKDLQYFFNQWVFKEGHPIYNYTFYQNPKTNEIDFTIRQSQVTTTRKEFKMPIQLLLDLEYQDTIITIDNQEIKEEYTFKTNQKVIDIILDPNEWLLKEIGTKKQILEMNNNSIYDVTIEQNLSGRHIEITLKSSKSQKAEFILKDVDENIVFSESLKVGGASIFKIEIPRNVLSGFHTMIIESKYERYYKDLMILD